MPCIEINNFHTDSKYSGGARPWVYAQISTNFGPNMNTELSLTAPTRFGVGGNFDKIDLSAFLQLHWPALYVAL